MLVLVGLVVLAQTVLTVDLRGLVRRQLFLRTTDAKVLTQDHFPVVVSAALRLITTVVQILVPVLARSTRVRRTLTQAATAAHQLSTLVTATAETAAAVLVALTVRAARAENLVLRSLALVVAVMAAVRMAMEIRVAQLAAQAEIIAGQLAVVPTEQRARSAAAAAVLVLLKMAAQAVLAMNGLQLLALQAGLAVAAVAAIQQVPALWRARAVFMVVAAAEVAILRLVMERVAAVAKG